MALNIWTQPSGYNLGTFPEKQAVNIALPTSSGPTFKIISGKLPPGLSIIGSNITGRPYEVARDTTFAVCIRASQNGQFSDRTFNMTVTNGNGPVFITPAGELDMGPEAQYFLMDKTYVDFNLQVFDANVAAGATLKYFIASGAGSLPPGLTLTPDGKITGFVLPLLYVTPQSGDGSYDNSYFDAVAYDFSIISTNGFDSYNFDDVFYDFNLPNNLPRQLNRNYQFVVSVTDGTLAVQRTFKIFVVGDDFFKADNTVLTDSTQYFTADVTYLRPPVWSTDSNLGLHRANNYITIPLETYDREYVLYTLEVVNARNTAITSTYAPSDNQATNTNLVIKKSNTIPLVNQYLTFDLRISGATSKIYKITSVSTIGNGFYRLGLDSPLEINIPDNVSFLIGDLPTTPPGMTFDENASILAGQVPYQPAVTKYYNFTITATRISSSSTERARSSRLFTVGIIGEIDSTITWNTPSNLGIITANLTSNLSVSASTSVPDANLIYTITAGKLPFGLTLSADGELVGRANQYTDPTKGTLGLTSFKSTSFDKNSTTFDRVYTFTIQAQDQFGYSATSRTFKLTIISPDTLSYSNIKTKPYLSIPQRTAFKSFINNSSVFTPSDIYRPNDPNFGVQAELKMVVYAGIETKAAAAYVGAMGLNHKRKQFYFGDLKTAVAVVPGTTTKVYEVVYVEMLDPLEPSGKRLANSLSLTPSEDYITTDSSQAFYSRNGGAAGPNRPYLSIDSTAYQVSDPHPQRYFPNSISNWQDRLGAIGTTERNYLPLWMRSIQPGTYEELGFVLAVPICYCKVGTAATILANIKNIEPFDFKQLNYTVDRYIIDAVAGQTNDKYLVFRNDRITV